MAVVGLITAKFANAQNIDTWTPESLKAHFGAASAQYVAGKIKTITFSAGPKGNFHGDQCFELILEVLRGAKDNPDLTGNTPNVDFGDTVWVDHETGCVITVVKPFHFIVTKDGVVVLTAHQLRVSSSSLSTILVRRSSLFALRATQRKNDHVPDNVR